MSGIYFVIVFVGVAVTQRHIQFFRLFAAPLRYDTGFFGCFDSLLDSLNGFLFLFRYQYVCHVLAAGGVTVRGKLAKYVGVTQSARAENYFCFFYYWCNHCYKFLMLNTLFVFVASKSVYRYAQQDSQIQSPKRMLHNEIKYYLHRLIDLCL